MLRIVMIGFLMVMLNLMASGQKWSFNNLVGVWKAESGPGLEVIDSNNVYLIFHDEKKKVNQVEFNFSSKPATLDLKIKDADGDIWLKSLFEFVNNDLIQWQVFENERPLNFTASRGELVYLRRKN